MRSKGLSIILLAAMLVAAACIAQPAAPESAALTEEAEAAPVEEPAAAPVEARTLTVLAAASLTESFTEIGTMFETQHEGVTVVFNFAGSQALAEQLAQGAAADVFASASNKYMTAAVDAQRVNAEASQPFAYNRLVVIFPKENPAGLAELKDLAKSGLMLDLADETVPVGQYALEFLDKASADAAYGTAFKDDVLANVVSYEENVKAVVTKVALGEADAGICYVTDITADAAASISSIDIPDELNTIATYPVAPITDSSNPELAQAFIDLLLSPEGQAVLAEYGFIPAASN